MKCQIIYIKWFGGGGVCDGWNPHWEIATIVLKNKASTSLTPLNQNLHSLENYLKETKLYWYLWYFVGSHTLMPTKTRPSLGATRPFSNTCLTRRNTFPAQRWCLLVCVLTTFSFPIVYMSFPLYYIIINCSYEYLIVPYCDALLNRFEEGVWARRPDRLPESEH